MGPNPVRRCPCKKWRLGQRQTHIEGRRGADTGRRRPCMRQGRPEAGRELGAGSPSWPQKGPICPHLGLGLLASTTVRQETTGFVVLCSNSPGKPPHLPTTPLPTPGLVPSPPYSQAPGRRPSLPASPDQPLSLQPRSSGFCPHKLKPNGFSEVTLTSMWPNPSGIFQSPCFQ